MNTCRFTGSTTGTSCTFKYWCREVAANGFGTWSSRSWLPFKQSSATRPPEQCNDLRQHDALDFKLRVAIHWVIWLIRGTCKVLKVEEISKLSHSHDDVPSAPVATNCSQTQNRSFAITFGPTGNYASKEYPTKGKKYPPYWIICFLAFQYPMRALSFSSASLSVHLD